MRTTSFFLILLFIMSGTLGFAHENHDEGSGEKPKQVLQVAPGQSAGELICEESEDECEESGQNGLIPKGTVERGNGNVEGERSEQGISPLQFSLFFSKVFEHLHNKLIHFPIGFGLAGILFLFLALKWEEFDRPAQIMLILGGIFAILSYFTGENQEEPFEKGILEPILEAHETLGILTSISLWLGVIFSFVPKIRKFLWIWGIVLLVLISLTGFYGGLLAHGGF